MYGVDFFDVSGFLSAIHALQKVSLALPVLASAFALARVFLWALLTPVCGRQAGLVADALAFCAASLLLAGGRGAAAVDWAAGLASRLLGAFPGAAGSGLPGFSGSGLDGAVREAADAFGGVSALLR